jgi:hypothetical protein
MAGKTITPNLRAVINQRSIPGVTMWNRLEGRPRAESFERALRAEVRDALWMLTRQWQMGEFRGDDAGSPVVAKVRVDTTHLQKYAPAHGKIEPLSTTIPLETRVEQLQIPLVRDEKAMSLDIRLLMGRYWLKLVGPLAPGARAEYIAAYPIDAPDPREPASADVAAHSEALAAVSAAAGRAMDGAKLYAYLTTQAGQRASDGIRSLAGLEAKADALGTRFVAWFQRLFTQPVQRPAWIPDRLEYQFACSAAEGAGQKVLTAEEYFHGRVEWYNFDVDRGREHFGDGMPLDAPVGWTRSMVPAPVSFGGMPNTRWWTFEDGRTNFGEVRPDMTDLAKLLLIEFGLVYANDWHIIPCTVPSGAIATVRGVAVTNVFGERTWIEAAGAGDDEDWQRWAMFLLSVKGHAQEAADLSLLIPPAAHKILDGPPIEDVVLARDEMANMVWGIERHVPLMTGESKPGREAADDMRRFMEQALERRLGHPPQAPPAAGDARVRYQLMTSVPENWIPFIPVHVPGDNREIQLQRASMPRVIEGDPDPPIAVRPRTSLLRPGLDRTPGSPYFVHEEEVPRAGVRVWQRYRRTRWRDGRVWVWLAVGKQTGRGEGSSGLAFDRLAELRR